MNDLDRNRPLTTADLAGSRERTREDGPESAGIIAPRPSEPVTEVPVRRERDEAAARPPAKAASPAQTDEKHESLLAAEETRNLRGEWDAIQTGFVDEPRQAVEKADQLVARAIQRLAEGFSDEKSKLEKQWARGDQVSTEDLRLALQRYRAFFGRLLSV